MSFYCLRIGWAVAGMPYLDGRLLDLVNTPVLGLGFDAKVTWFDMPTCVQSAALDQYCAAFERHSR